MGHPDCIQAHLGDIAGSVPDHHNKVSHNFSPGGRSRLQVTKKSASVKHNKVKLNKRKYAYIKQMVDLIICINKILSLITNDGNLFAL